MKTRVMSMLMIFLLVIAGILAACKQEADVEMGSRVFGSPAYFRGEVFVDGESDAIQAHIQGHSTQTSDLLVLEQSDGTDVFNVDNDGNVDVSGAVTFDGGILDDSLEIDITTAANEAGIDIDSADASTTNYTDLINAEWTPSENTTGGSNGIYAISNAIVDLQNAYALRGRMDMRDQDSAAVEVNQLHSVDALINLSNQVYTVIDNISVYGAAMHSVGITAGDVIAAGATGGSLNLFYGVWGDSVTEDFTVGTNGMQIVTHANTNLDYGLNVSNSGDMDAGLLLDGHTSNSPATMDVGVEMVSAADKMIYGIDMSAADFATAGADIRFESGETLSNEADATFEFARNDAGIVTLIAADDDAVAGITLDAGGASPIVVGSADVTAITLTTAGNEAILSAAPAAGQGGDLLNLRGTFAIADGTDGMVGLGIDLTGANHTGTGNRTSGIELGLTTPDPQVPEKGLLITDTDWDYAIDTGAIPIFSSAAVWFEDFYGTTMPDEMTLLNGTDPQALDPAIAQGQYGIVQLVGGDSNANPAADSSILALGLHWSADQGSLVFETRVHIDDITTSAMCVGMTDDIATVEMPFTLTADTDTGIAVDYIGFCFATDATTDEWWFVGNNNGTEATGNAATGVAPANGVFQVLRVEVDANGEDARGYIDGVLVGTITANSVAEAVLLSPSISVQPLVAATRTVTLDYIYVGAQRQ